tara:strand:+ start:192 stop:338 length:147 start_codon:yes stop_codon:yes gene_type:complete
MFVACFNTVIKGEEALFRLAEGFLGMLAAKISYFLLMELVRQMQEDFC